MQLCVGCCDNTLKESLRDMGASALVVQEVVLHEHEHSVKHVFAEL